MKRSVPASRRGAVLILVLIVIPLLALGAYSFTHAMRAEGKAALVAQRQQQARWFAQSGIEMVKALLTDPNSLDPVSFDLKDNPNRFAAQWLYDDPATGLRGAFSIISPREDGGTNALRFGLENESAKIPLHNRQLLQRRDAFLGLSGMTEEIADAILDWIDSDDTPRELGVESSYYLSLSQPYPARNGTPQTLDELLQVKGVTPALLYGEDANLNGILDANENDGDASWPPDNSDGVLDRGWYPYLTIYSVAANPNPEGEPKINLNGDLTSSQDRLKELFGEELVTFLTAYKRQNPGQTITTISQLIDAVVVEERSEGEGRNRRTVQVRIECPFKSSNVNEYLATALEELTTTDAATLPGLIDVNDAPAPVLRCLPGVTDEIASRIAAAAKNRGTPELTAAWLLTENLVTLAEFRQLEPYVTGTGRVYRVQSVGFFDPGGGTARVEAVLDVSSGTPTILSRRDFPAAGSDLTPSWLTTGLP